MKPFPSQKRGKNSFCIHHHSWIHLAGIHRGRLLFFFLLLCVAMWKKWWGGVLSVKGNMQETTHFQDCVLIFFLFSLLSWMSVCSRRNEKLIVWCLSQPENQWWFTVSKWHLSFIFGAAGQNTKSGVSFPDKKYTMRLILETFKNC